jgi:two-component system, LytTR family, sensor kinase
LRCCDQYEKNRFDGAAVNLKMTTLNRSGSYFHWKSLAIIFASWTLIGFLTGNRHYLIGLQTAGAGKWGETILRLLLLYAWPWALVTPLIFYLADRFPMRHGRFLRHLAIHFSLSLFLGLTLIAVEDVAAGLLWNDDVKPGWLTENFLNSLRFCLHIEMLTYWAILGIRHGFVWYYGSRERELESAWLQLKVSEMEAGLKRAQLDALKMQLHPHFLFNTLNTISVLMPEDVGAARRVLFKLGDLLRATLKTSDHEITLRQELELLRLYLEIEQTRFQDRLTVRMNIDPDTLDARTPTLILQPIVENAIKHGIARRSAPGIVEVSAARNNGAVELRVSDNGSEMADIESGKPAGVGLANVRARLEKLYPGTSHFEMKKGELGGMEIFLSIPHRTA